MSEPCAFCGGPCNPYDQQTWKQVVGWVGGPRKDSMRLRGDTGQYAHDSCVQKAQAGIDPKSQPTLEDEETVPVVVACGDEADDPQWLDDLFAPSEEVKRDEPDFSGTKFESDGEPPF
jgi:hypothetical protein